jgi:hypothetical protein
VESGIEGALFDGEEFVGCFLDVENDAVAVGFANMGKSFENEEIETALEVVACHVSSPR